MMRKASIAYGSLLESRDFASFSSRWTDFLSNWNAVFLVLEKGSQSNPQSRHWFGEIKQQRRADPLLNYLLQARNADEHGIEPIISKHIGATIVGINGESVHIQNLTIRGGELIQMGVLPVEGVLPTIIKKPDGVKLIPIFDDRFGNTFYPPKEHLGVTLSDTSPISVAEKGLRFCDTTLAEAGKRSARQ